MADDEQPNAGSISIQWSVISGGSIVVAIAAITALVIVAAVRKVDTLSTVALSLAILAFMTQIMVFITQTWSTSKLNAETRAFLAELRTRSQGTETMLNKQVDKLTDDLMGRAAAARKRTSSPAEARELVRRDVERALIGTPPAVAFTEHPMNVKSVSKAESDRLAKHLATYPSPSEEPPLREIFDGLTPPAVGQLARFARDAYEVYRDRSGVPGFPGRHPLPSAQKALVNAGLLEDTTNPEGPPNPLGDHGPWLTLTEKGRDVARLLTSVSAPGGNPEPE